MKAMPPFDASEIGPHRTVSKAWKWWLCIVLFLATMLNYLDRQTMSVCAPLICKEFQLNNEQFGDLLAAFRWTYAFTHIPAGFIADRFSLRLFYGCAVGLWSLAGALAFWVTSVGVFKWTRGLLGIGEAFNWPCATRIVANMLPRADRGLAMGIFNSGAAAGSLIAPFIIAPIAVSLGWRYAFLIIGALGALWIILWWAVTRGRADVFSTAKEDRPKAANAADVVRPFGVILSHPGFWLLILVSITINPCWYFLCEWSTKYMHDVRGFTVLGAGIITVPIFLGGDLGNFLGGGIVKYLCDKKGFSVRQGRAAAVAVGAVLVLPVVFISHIENPYIALGLLAVAGLGITSIVPNQTACQPEVSFKNTAQLAGLTGCAANIFAALLNPQIGKYIDKTHNYDLVFLCLAIFPLITLGAIVLFDTIIARQREREGRKGEDA
jgi:ACS family hexuronate transporter-like MFS transporter